MHAYPTELSRSLSMRIAQSRSAQLPDHQSMDAQRHALLIQENAMLARQLGEVQRRVTQQLAQHARVIQTLQAQCVQLRAAVIARDTALSMRRPDTTERKTATPAAMVSRR